MTAYLQPGDKIHLAFPITILTAWDQDDVNAHVRQMGAELTQIYKGMGVEVVVYSSSTGLDRPTVVAVVREPVKGFATRPTPGKFKLVDEDPLPWQDPPEATERPRAKEFLPHGLPPE